MATINAQMNYFNSSTGLFDAYHIETSAEQVVNFSEGVTNVLNNSNYAMAFRLPTSDCGLANAIWIDMES